MECKSFGDAIVIGGSMAGLLAARVLADYFETVTVIERDERSERPEPRRGVPQGRHAHGLLLRGQDTITRLFSGIREELIAAGATPVNMGRDVKWFHFDVWKSTTVRTSAVCACIGATSARRNSGSMRIS
jgi:flavin-dependent dehydrogenase